jgi:hypothetical protein
MARRQAAATSWALGWKPGFQRPSEHREGLEPSSPHYECGVLAARSPVLVVVSGTGGYRTHIIRFKRPAHYLVCHNPNSVGAVGIEPTFFILISSFVIPLKSGRWDSNPRSRVPKTRGLAAALHPVNQSERPDLNRRSLGPQPSAIPGFATFCLRADPITVADAVASRPWETSPVFSE